MLSAAHRAAGRPTVPALLPFTAKHPLLLPLFARVQLLLVSVTAGSPHES